MKDKKLTTMEALMLVAGAGVGTGILTIPYAIGQIGICGTILALVIAVIISLITYFLIADLTLKAKYSGQILGILQEHLIKGKHQKILTYLFFTILVIVLIENLIVYILCATDILTDLLGIPIIASKTIFYVLASVVIFFGIKGVGIGEKYSVAIITAVILILIVLSLFHPQNSLDFGFGEPKKVVAVYGLFMFAFSAIFSVVQVTTAIENKKNIKKVLIGGLFLNASLTLLFSIATIIGSKEVTEVANIGLVQTLDKLWIKIIVSAFVLLSMFSSYWSTGLAFADIIKDQFHVGKNVAWIGATGPAIILAILLPLSILDYIQIGAGALSVMIGLTVIPAYYQMTKDTKQELLLGKHGRSKLLLGIAGIGIIIMAVASCIPIH